MSCHGTPGNSAVTSLACALTATPSDEVSRRFHQLKAEAAGQGAPTEEEVLGWLDRQVTVVRTDEALTAWRRDRLLARVGEARDAAAAGQLPDGPTWHAWQNIRAACDDAHTHQWLAAQAGLALPLSESEPAQIDERLAIVWDEIYRELDRKARLATDIARAERDLRQGRYGVTAADVERRRTALTDCEKRIDKLVDETEPFEAEYRRRGGWARYYRVVTNGSDAHVHSSRSCGQCYPTTRYVWLPALSGKGEEEAVDQYGREMCSYCFPGVLDHPSYRTRGAIAEEAATRREAAVAARRAERDAKGIANPDGTPLVIGEGRWPDTIRTAVTAERTLVEYLADLQRRYSDAGIQIEMTRFGAGGSTRAAGDYEAHLRALAARYRADADRIARALAHKRGITAQELLDGLAARVTARVRRDQRAEDRALARYADDED